MNTKDIREEIDAIVDGFLINSESVNTLCELNLLSVDAANITTQSDEMLGKIGGKKISKNDLRLNDIYGEMATGMEYPLFLDLC